MVQRLGQTTTTWKYLQVLPQPCQMCVPEHLNVWENGPKFLPWWGAQWAVTWGPCCSTFLHQAQNEAQPPARECMWDQNTGKPISTVTQACQFVLILSEVRYKKLPTVKGSKIRLCWAVEKPTVPSTKIQSCSPSYSWGPGWHSGWGPSSWQHHPLERQKTLLGPEVSQPLEY